MTAERARVGELSERLAEAERGLQRLTDLENQLAAVTEVGIAKDSRIHELEKMVAAAQEFEKLLATERDRNAVLARRVSESEQSAEQSMKRFEDMARKLGEIAGLASQLGSGKGRV
jgi:chromatin segregation and condensation protein Rec8/ScpA/Scc1 (kleisin family)